jgi:CBS domain-containing protein
MSATSGTGHDEPMKARDVMTANVVAVAPNAPVGEVARLLLENQISAVPVVDAGGIPIGMVSEGDIVGREEPERLARTDWWLAMVTGELPLDDTLKARLRAGNRTARDVMSAPLVTVSEDTAVRDIARLFAIHHIKRVPVIRDGRIAGIVSRADLLRVIAAAEPVTHPANESHQQGFFSSLFGEYHLPARETVAGISAAMQAKDPPPAPDETRLSADDLRHLATDFHQSEADHKDADRRSAALQRRERAARLIDSHVLDEGWRQLLHRARVAAENGETEILVSRFPSQLCIDGGRAINVSEPGWPASLRGTPAEIYLRWERDLKQRNFSLNARVLEFPDGKPGDIGLFLTWKG